MVGREAFLSGMLSVLYQEGLMSNLQPIPGGGALYQVGVDMLQASAYNHKYVVVFMDYFTKWPEAYPIADQKTETIAQLFVDNILCRH